MISIIICSRDDRKFRNIQQVFQRVLARIEFEIIRMKDVRSLTSGYNQGVRLAKKREVWKNIPFDETYSGGFLFGLDFTFSAWIAGYRLAVCADWATLQYPTALNEDSEAMEFFTMKNSPWMHDMPVQNSHLAAIKSDNLETLKIPANPERWRRQPEVRSPGGLYGSVNAQ